MRKLRWVLLAVLLVMLGVLGVSYLQKRFDEADIRKGLRAIEGRVPPGITCNAEVVSRFRGHVRVQCGDAEWLVDVVKGIVGKPLEGEKNE